MTKHQAAIARSQLEIIRHELIRTLQKIDRLADETRAASHELTATTEQCRWSVQTAYVAEGMAHAVCLATV